MSDTFGPSSRTPLAFYDPDSSSWRTSAGTLPLDSMPSSVTLPASGMTQDGVLYELPTLAPAIAEPVSSCSPTPAGGDAKSTTNQAATRHKIPPTGVHAGVTMTDFVRLLPTPSARDHKDGAGTTWHPEKVRLPHTIGSLLPTPRTSDSNGVGMHGQGGLDLRTVVAFNGDHTRPQLPDTNESSDDQPLTLWTNWGD